MLKSALNTWTLLAERVQIESKMTYQALNIIAYLTDEKSLNELS